MSDPRRQSADVAHILSEAKRARADYVIENAGSLEDLEEEVDRVWGGIVGDSVHSAAGAS